MADISGIGGELPAWAREFAERYFSRTQSTFVLYGNVRDIVRSGGYPAADTMDKSAVLGRVADVADAGGADFAGRDARGAHRAASDEERTSPETIDYIPLTDFLTRHLFAQRRYVIYYDLSRGLSFADVSMQQAFLRTVKSIDMAAGTKWADAVPSDPHGVLKLIHRFIQAKTVASDPDERRIAVVVDYAETVFPRADVANLAGADRAAEIALLRLAGSPDVLGGDVTLVLISRDRDAVSERVTDNEQTAAIAIPPPSYDERLAFLKWFASKEGGAGWWDEVETVAGIGSGLTLTQLRNILMEVSQARDGVNWRGHFTARKRSLIERDCGGMLEFVGSEKQKLNLVAVHREAVAELRRDAALLRNGETTAVPSGYLICGPSGSGKSFMIRCFAGEAGVPCVELRNFRDKWVGATEGNLERLLSVLYALAPVVVIVDEADAALGDRSADESDSGLSGRVFSRLVSFMGDAENRGKVVWFLITNRPDLLTIDLKRQGRAEKHIPLFPPDTAEDYEELFRLFVLKHGFIVTFGTLSAVCDPAGLKLSGSDLESVLFRAHALSRTAGQKNIEPEHMRAALADFSSPEYPDEIEYQALLGVMESTSKALVPANYRMDRAALARKVSELKMRLPRG